MFVFPPKDEVCDALTEWSQVKESIFQENFPLHQACRDGDVNKLAGLLALIVSSQSSYTVQGKCDSVRKHTLSLSSDDPFYGWMPSHWAAYFGKLECLKLVIQASRYVDVPSCKLLQTPAHIAAFAGNFHSLQWLLDSGADHSRWDYMRETPLHKAARTGSIDCISLLIARGSKLHWENCNSKTAAHIAQECGNTEAAQYLFLQMQLQSSISTKKVLPTNNQNSVSVSNGYYGYQSFPGAAKVEDVLLLSSVSNNLECIGGRKRSRETYHSVDAGKRLCLEGGGTYC